METKTVEQALAEVQHGAQVKVVHETRRIESIEIGQAVRQGDVYLHRVADDHPRGARTSDMQLALGNTQGSRHYAPQDSEVYQGTQAPDYARGAFLGPLVRLFKRDTFTHPEHADYDMPAGTYQVTHQMDARTLGRVRD